MHSSNGVCQLDQPFGLSFVNCHAPFVNCHAFVNCLAATTDRLPSDKCSAQLLITASPPPQTDNHLKSGALSRSSRPRRHYRQITIRKAQRSAAHRGLAAATDRYPVQEVGFGTVVNKNARLHCESQPRRASHNNPVGLVCFAVPPDLVCFESHRISVCFAVPPDLVCFVSHRNCVIRVVAYA